MPQAPAIGPGFSSWAAANKAASAAAAKKNSASNKTLASSAAKLAAGKGGLSKTALGVFPKLAAAQKGAASDPYQDLLDFVNGQGGGAAGGGSGGGGGGGGGAIAALNAQLRNNAASRYQTNKTQVTDIYGQLRDQLAPNAGLTAARYNTAIQNSANAGGQIAAQANSQNTAQDAQANNALQSLGVNVPGAVTAGADAANQKGLTTLANNNATWGNLNGVLSNAQQSRDQLDVQGASDAGAVAQNALLNSYEDYLRQLDASSASASGGGGGSGGGGSGKAAKPSALENMLNTAIFNKLAVGAGLKAGPTVKTSNVPTAKAQAAYLKAVSAANKNAGGTASKNQVIAQINKSKSPASALAALKYYG